MVQSVLRFTQVEVEGGDRLLWLQDVVSTGGQGTLRRSAHFRLKHAVSHLYLEVQGAGQATQAQVGS